MTDTKSQISTRRWPGVRVADGIGRRICAVVSALAVTTVIAGCASTADGPASVPTRVPATPVAAPLTTTPAMGSVVEMPVNITGVAIDEANQSLLVQSTAPDKLTSYSIGDLSTPKFEVELAEGVGPIAFTATGTALAPSPQGLAVISLTDGDVKAAKIDGAALSAAATPDGRYAVGTDTGSVVILSADLTPERTVTGFVSVDGLTATDGALAALDAHQTSVTEVTVDDGTLSGALRAGIGSTQIVSDQYGRVIAADTDGGQIVVFSVDPLLNRQMGPVGESPYGLADDVGRNLIWVTLTGTNEVAAFDLSSGAPEEKFRFPTVEDPRSVAVDAQTGDLYVGSGAGGGLQRISAAEIQ